MYSTYIYDYMYLMRSIAINVIIWIAHVQRTLLSFRGGDELTDATDRKLNRSTQQQLSLGLIENAYEAESPNIKCIAVCIMLSRSP